MVPFLNNDTNFLGIVVENLKWMFKAASEFKDKSSIFNGFLLLEEMAIQPDLQVVKKGEHWELVGAIDLGPLLNDLHSIGQKQDFQLATHCFQYIYQSFSGFRWPVAFYGSHNANGHLIYLTFWPLVDALSMYGFKIDGALLDRSSNNRQFMKHMLNPNKTRMLQYIATDPYDPTAMVALVQDCKHMFNKIRISIISSSTSRKTVRTLKWRGDLILWQHFEAAFHFNNKTDLHLYKKLSRNHIYPKLHEKMRNHLAENVLNKDMLNLFTALQKSVVRNSVVWCDSLTRTNITFY